MKHTGVTARGIISPIFRQGDDIVEGVCACVMEAAKNEGFTVDDGDIIGVTESVVARSQGNYADCAHISADIRRKLGGRDMGIVFPILSRNRFSVLLKAIAEGCDRLYIQLSYPADEVGNALLSYDALDERAVNPYTDSFDERSFRAAFGQETVHPFTGVDYIEYYKSLGGHIEILFSNDPRYILSYTKNVLCCDIHTRARTKRILKAGGAQRLYGLDDIMTESIDGSGYNPDYGLLGSNMATGHSVKLFPRDCEAVVNGIRRRMGELCGKQVEALIYGDGCFKDPIGGIWELADPVVSPAFTPGLGGTPSEIKIKYFADNELAALSGDELSEAVRGRIKSKQADLTGSMASQGTTPRRFCDLVGSLCDLVSGSGDRGTPVIHIKNYFTNFAT